MQSLSIVGKNVARTSTTFWCLFLMSDDINLALSRAVVLFIDRLSDIEVRSCQMNDCSRFSLHGVFSLFIIKENWSASFCIKWMVSMTSIVKWHCSLSVILVLAMSINACNYLLSVSQFCWKVKCLHSAGKPVSIGEGGFLQETRHWWTNSIKTPEG